MEDGLTWLDELRHGPITSRHRATVTGTGRPDPGHGGRRLAVARPALEFQRVPFADGTLPKSAAILAVADGYILARDGDGTQEALGERAGFAAVRRESGTRYDPSVVDALGRLLRRARP